MIYNFNLADAAGYSLLICELVLLTAGPGAPIGPCRPAGPGGPWKTQKQDRQRRVIHSTARSVQLSSTPL